ncbi:hypothetical protein MKZ38_003952 [Zalerion maritima]|uniref:Uncharacterized protein n=1 Tax=Zalerion maritima TaxID=339359 RepID=A0AAD5WRD5_9PEZI|nr:hypothetical protein MKZ38_003952 [Zalerion maritima]
MPQAITSTAHITVQSFPFDVDRVEIDIKALIWVCDAYYCQCFITASFFDRDNNLIYKRESFFCVWDWEHPYYRDLRTTAPSRSSNRTPSPSYSHADSGNLSRVRQTANSYSPPENSRSASRTVSLQQHRPGQNPNIAAHAPPQHYINPYTQQWEGVTRPGQQYYAHTPGSGSYFRY